MATAASAASGAIVLGISYSVAKQLQMHMAKGLLGASAAAAVAGSGGLLAYYSAVSAWKPESALSHTGGTLLATAAFVVPVALAAKHLNSLVAAGVAPLEDRLAEVTFAADAVAEAAAAFGAAEKGGGRSQPSTAPFQPFSLPAPAETAPPKPEPLCSIM
eukprot:tig00000350_g24317.t1